MLSVFYKIFAVVLLLCVGTGAFAAPPKKLRALEPAELRGVFSNDVNAVELRDFHATLLTDNLHAFESTVTMFDQAVEKAVLSTFIWTDDLSGKAVAMAAIRAARRGVEVTVLIDGMDVRTEGRRMILAAMKAEGVRVKLFHPFRQASKFLKRHHDKAQWVKLPSGEVLFKIGGRNQGDYYYLGNETFDADVVLRVSAEEGERLYREQFETFLRSKAVVDWEARFGYPHKGYDAAEHLSVLMDLEQAEGLARWFFANKKPTHPKPHPEVEVRWGEFVRNRGRRAAATRAMEAVMAWAKRRLTIANAYVVPNDSMRDILEKQLKAGTTVNLFTTAIEQMESRWHRAIIHLMDFRIRKLVPYLGVFARTRGEAHVKTLVADRRVVAIGSANLDGRSERHDTQSLVVLDAPKLADQFEDTLGRQLVDGDYKERVVVSAGPIAWCTRLLLYPFRMLF